MDKVIVTGVNGFVGGHLVNELIEQGYEVVGIGREEFSDAALTNKLHSYFACDLSDYEQVRKLSFKDIKAVINLAGLAAVGPSFDNPELYMRINTAVLDTICKSVIEQECKDIRIVSISSGAVYGSQQPMPLTESSELAPESSPYAASKIAMEELSQKYRDDGLDCVVARPFNHVGPGQAPGFLLPDLYQKLLSVKESGAPLLVGNITTRRDYTDVRDVARAYVNLVSAEKLSSAIYNVCTGRSLSGEEILAVLLETMDMPDVRPEVDSSQFRPSDAPDLYGDHSKLTNDTDWQPTISIEQTIKDFVSWSQAK